MKTIKISEGKAGSKLEGKIILTATELDPADEAQLAEGGLLAIGRRETVSLWQLPEQMSLDAARQLRDAILKEDRPSLERPPEASGVAQDPAEPAAGKAPTPEAPTSEADAFGPAVQDIEVATPAPAAPAPPAATVASVPDVMAGKGKGVEIGYGYRLGMSVPERDQFRMPVRAGSVKPGDRIETPAGEREVLFLSAILHVGRDQLPEMQRRFPQSDILTSDLEMQLAAWAVTPEEELAPSGP